MAFVNHIIPRGKRDFSKIHLWRDTSRCILYVKLQSLRDTPKYNAVIKIFCTDPFYYDWNHLEGWHSSIGHFHFSPLAKGHPNTHISTIHISLLYTYPYYTHIPIIPIIHISLLYTYPYYTHMPAHMIG